MYNNICGVKLMIKNTKIIAMLIVIILIFTSVLAYYAFQPKEKTKPVEEPSEEFQVDNRISPYTNQGLFVEILRIRNRGLLDKMLKIGTSWRETPSFYYTLNVDGKEASSKGNIGESGVYNEWDTFGKESTVCFYVEEEQKTSDVTITIMEIEKKGLLGRKTVDVEKESIHLVYDYRTGRWSGDDYFRDDNGYGHYLGENYEIWFNIYQSDYDHDGIPYWTEVNVLHTDPTVDDRELDPDNDGIPTSWEWRWGYDPFIWNDHKNLDPDIDGIENIEEYKVSKWLSNPYQPDIYIETDGMQKKGIIDLPHIFYKESQQMLIERFAQHGINVYIDDGWPDGPVNGGGEMLPFHKNLDDVNGKQMLQFYEHNFADERKGIFRYLVVGNEHGGFTNPVKYNYFDTIHVGSGIKPTFKTRLAFTPRFIRVALAKVVLHELGHTLGLVPITFPGNDIMSPIGVRYPSMPKDEYEKFYKNYHSIMNYRYIFMDRKLFDYSDGSNGAPYDQNDWEQIYLPTFQTDMISYEEPVDETFEDFEIVDDYPGITVKGYTFDKNLTEKYRNDFTNLVTVKNTGVNISIYVKIDGENETGTNVRIYAMPNVAPVHAVWSLVAEGYLDSSGNIRLYSQQNIINSLLS